VESRPIAAWHLHRGFWIGTMLTSDALQAYNVFSYLVLDLGFSPVTLSVGW
jgi:hypothetical protein